MKCYCGSEKPYSGCCKPVIEGSTDAGSPEALMRARYSAYAAGKIGFLSATHDPAQKNDFDEEAARAWADNAEWLGLDIVSSSGNAPDDSQGYVEFIARYREGGKEQAHHERSSFIKRSGKWYFSSGRMIVDQVVRGEQKTGRNDPCPCGSGKKYKKCCGR